MTERKKPRSVTWLLLLVLSFTGASFLRLVAALEEWSFLGSLPLNVSPFIIAFSGLIGTLTGLGLIWGLWQRAPWAPQATRLASLVYAVYFWVDRLGLSASPLRAVNWPFALAATLLLLGFVLWVLSRPGVRAYFGESDE